MSKTVFGRYEVKTCRDVEDSEGEVSLVTCDKSVARFWAVYRRDDINYLEALRHFSDRNNAIVHAEYLYEKDMKKVVARATKSDKTPKQFVDKINDAIKSLTCSLLDEQHKAEKLGKEFDWEDSDLDFPRTILLDVKEYLIKNKLGQL